MFGDPLQDRDSPMNDDEGVAMSLEEFSVGDHGVERERAHPSQIARAGPQETTIRDDHCFAWSADEAEALDLSVR